MFRRDFMPRPYNAALKKREGRFHSICVHVTVRVVLGMVNGLVKVLLHLVKRPRIDGRFIRHNHFYVTPNVGVDNLSDGCGLRILGTNHAQIAVALPNADYNRYSALWTPTAFLTRNVGFVNLYCAAEFFGRYFQHRSANSMAEVPSCLVAHSKRP